MYRQLLLVTFNILFLSITVYATQPFRSTLLLTSPNNDTIFMEPLASSIEAVPTDPTLFLVGTLTGDVSLIRININSTAYSHNETVSKISAGPGRSVISIRSDPFLPNRFYISTSTLQWKAQGFPESGWQNGRIDQLDINPSNSSLSITRPIAQGLPVSLGSSTTYGTAIDTTSGFMYVGIGSFTNGGVPTPQSGNLPDCLASGAMLKIDIRSPSKTRVLNWSSDNPFEAELLTSAEESGIEIYATGLRSPFSPVFASDNNLYVIDAGAALESPRSTSCTTSQPFTEVQADRLVSVSRGGWYGAANRRRGQNDPRQCQFIWTSSKDAPDSFIPPVLDTKAAIEANETGTGLTGCTEYSPVWIKELENTLLGVSTVAVKDSGDGGAPRGIVSFDIKKKSVKRIADVTGIGITVDAFGSILTAKFTPGDIGVAIPRKEYLYGKNGNPRIGNVFPTHGIAGSRIYIAGTNLPQHASVRIGKLLCQDVKREFYDQIELVSCTVPKILRGWWRPNRRFSVSVGSARLRRAFLVLDDRKVIQT